MNNPWTRPGIYTLADIEAAERDLANEIAVLAEEYDPDWRARLKGCIDGDTEMLGYMYQSAGLTPPLEMRT